MNNNKQYETKGFWATVGECIGLVGLLVHGTKVVAEDSITITTNISGSAVKLSEVAVLYSDNLSAETTASMSNTMESKVEDRLDSMDKDKIEANPVLSDEAKARLITKLEAL